MKQKKRKIQLKLVIVLFIFILFSMSSTIVEPGYKGIVFNLGSGVKKEVLNPGLNFHLPYPISKVTQYPISTETVYLTRADDDQSFDVNTSDGKSVNVDVVYSYHMDEQKLPHIFTKFRRKTHEEIEETYIKTLIKTIMQETTTKYSVLGVYTEKRTEVTKQISQNLSKVLAKDGIILENFAMSDVRPDSKTLKSLQAIADAQNRQEFLKRDELNKKQEVINNKIEAEGKKQVMMIEAEGKAEANKKLNASLTPVLIQYEWIKKWNGKLPSVQGDQGNLIQIPPIQEKK